MERKITQPVVFNLLLQKMEALFWEGLTDQTGVEVVRSVELHEEFHAPMQIKKANN